MYKRTKDIVKYKIDPKRNWVSCANASGDKQKRAAGANDNAERIEEKNGVEKKKANALRLIVT